ncbi:partial two-component system, sensor histidine kinase, partial [uncultured bacterium]
LFMMMLLFQDEEASPAFQHYWPGFSGLCFFVYAFLGMRLLPATLLGLGSFALVWWAGSIKAVEASQLDNALLHLAVINGLGMMICARMEVQERILFRHRQHHRSLTRNAREQRLDAQEARDEALLENTRAEAALMLAKAEREKLAAAILEKERFLSAAYHDLQQPLCTIGLFVRLAKHKLNEEPGPDLKPELAIIENASQDIALMFKGVRDTWEIGATAPTIEAVDVRALLDEIGRELNGRAERKGLAFRIRKPRHPQVFASSDKTLLKRALSNLVSNAIKYTKTGGVLAGVVVMNGQARIDVWDTGVGIPAEFKSLIFEEYFQVNNHNGDPKRGLGLGLSIVRRIEQHLPGHRLRFASKPGQGSRFSLYAPLGCEPAPDCPALDMAQAHPGPDRALHGKYVVVVEDEPANLDGLVRAIGDAGCLVEGVDSAASARRLFKGRERCPDILVTDCLLRHGETGLDAVAAMRERFEWAAEVPVLFVTGDLDPETKLAKFKGVFAIHRKPIDTDALLAKMRELLSPLLA